MNYSWQNCLSQCSTQYSGTLFQPGPLGTHAIQIVMIIATTITVGHAVPAGHPPASLSHRAEITVLHCRLLVSAREHSWMSLPRAFIRREKLSNLPFRFLFNYSSCCLIWENPSFLYLISLSSSYYSASCNTNYYASCMPAWLMSYIKDREFCNLQRETHQIKQNHSPNKSFILPLHFLQLLFRRRHFFAAQRQTWGRAPRKKQIAYPVKWSYKLSVFFFQCYTQFVWATSSCISGEQFIQKSSLWAPCNNQQPSHSAKEQIVCPGNAVSQMSSLQVGIKAVVPRNHMLHSASGTKVGRGIYLLINKSPALCFDSKLP